MPMEEEKLMENEAKKQKERETMKWRAKISAPTLFNSPKAKSTQKKFSFPSFQFHILIAQILKPKSLVFFFFFFFFKFQTSDFMIKIPSLNFQNSKAQSFRFQINNFLSSKVLEFEIRISNLPSFKDQMFLKRKIFC